MTVQSEADALAAKYPNKPRSVCGVAASGHGALIEALSDRGLSNTRISEVLLIEKGASVSYQTIQRHKTGICSCQK